MVKYGKGERRRQGGRMVRVCEKGVYTFLFNKNKKYCFWAIAHCSSHFFGPLKNARRGGGSTKTVPGMSCSQSIPKMEGGCDLARGGGRPAGRSPPGARPGVRADAKTVFA